jgi:hypothetical protein
LPRRFAQSSLKQVYKPKIREEQDEKMDVDPKRTTSQDAIQIGTMDFPIEKDSKRQIVLSDQVGTSTQNGSVANNDHEASGSSSNSKYFLLRWSPPGLTRTQGRKLQRLRFRENKEEELEKQRDKMFNLYMPMVPQGKELRIKTSVQAGPVKPVEEAVKPAQAVKPGVAAVKPPGLETLLVSAPLNHMACDNELSSAPGPEDNEQLIDYSSSPERIIYVLKTPGRYNRFQ